MRQWDPDRQRWTDDAEGMRQAAPGDPAPPAPPGDPHRPHPTRPQRLVLAGLAMVLFGAAAGTGGWFLVRDEAPGAKSDAAPSASPSASAPVAPPDDKGTKRPGDGAPVPSTAPGSSAPVPGFSRAAGPEGFTVDVPDGWEGREEQGVAAPVVSYESPDRRRQLHLFWVEDPTPYKSLELAEGLLLRDEGKARAYERLALRRIGERNGSGAGPIRKSAEWKYTYVHPEHGLRYVVDRRFQAEDGELYAIRAIGPAEDRESQNRLLQTARATFCLEGTPCPGTGAQP
ncbi:hypothetical protein LHJ74_21700 [Streptomyces sp. N2-109]|uniref:Serine/threonine protein kinase n=1 Tax=Streptomyces gossypii TaxID=2883101 RepID=A0ABT2JX77_9ACTN|nr:hypothetical protein [Streptomyces gossypii]MCT2592490.1 hypothetical protein [Streptomyces gossypii]